MRQRSHLPIRAIHHFFGVIVTGGANLFTVALNGGSGVENYTMDNMIVVVPEPGSISLLALGSVALVGAVIRRRKA